MTAGSARGDIAADWALTQLDKPYVWAAAGPAAYDCSGLTMRAWERVGIAMDHWTGTQWTAGPHVRLSELQRGDLLFYGQITQNPGDIHHVGIYIGRGLMVHAPQTGTWSGSRRCGAATSSARPVPRDDRPEGDRPKSDRPKGDRLRTG